MNRNLATIVVAAGIFASACTPAPEPKYCYFYAVMDENGQYNFPKSKLESPDEMPRISAPHPLLVCDKNTDAYSLVIKLPNEYVVRENQIDSLAMKLTEYTLERTRSFRFIQIGDKVDSIFSYFVVPKGEKPDIEAARDNIYGILSEIRKTVPERPEIIPIFDGAAL